MNERQIMREISVPRGVVRGASQRRSPRARSPRTEVDVINDSRDAHNYEIKKYLNSGENGISDTRNLNK